MQARGLCCVHESYELGHILSVSLPFVFHTNPFMPLQQFRVQGSARNLLPSHARILSNYAAASWPFACASACCRFLLFAAAFLLFFCSSSSSSCAHPESLMQKPGQYQHMHKALRLVWPILHDVLVTCDAQWRCKGGLRSACLSQALISQVCLREKCDQAVCSACSATRIPAGLSVAVKRSLQVDHVWRFLGGFPEGHYCRRRHCRRRRRRRRCRHLQGGKSHPQIFCRALPSEGPAVGS